MLNDPIQRAILAKTNVRDSKIEDEDNPRIQWQQKIVGKRVDIRVQLRDSRVLLEHLKMIEETCRTLRVALVQLKDEQARLYLAGATIRELSKKTSPYRRWT